MCQYQGHIPLLPVHLEQLCLPLQRFERHQEFPNILWITISILRYGCKSPVHGMLTWGLVIHWKSECIFKPRVVISLLIWSRYCDTFKPEFLFSVSPLSQCNHSFKLQMHLVKYLSKWGWFIMLQVLLLYLDHKRSQGLLLNGLQWFHFHMLGIYYF